MGNRQTFLSNVIFIFICGGGGFLLSLTGISIGWMIGTLLVSAFFAMKRDSFAKNSVFATKIPRYWINIGQFILGIQLGQRINLSIIETFQSHWAVIVGILFVSIFFAMGSGFILWKFTSADFLTSFFSAAPGGLSAMPSIAEEEGANTVIVSIVQTMRVFLVLLTVPVIVSAYAVTESGVAQGTTGSIIEISQFGWTFMLIIVALLGSQIGKLAKIPSRWIIGSMMGVALLQGIAGTAFQQDIIAWWPDNLTTISQIILGASIGSGINKNMFQGMQRTIPIAFLTTLSLIFITFLCAYFVSRLTNISLMTAALAFAPGGIAEMATTAIVVQADSTFVVAVQVLRLMIVLIVLPVVFRIFHQKYQVKQKQPMPMSNAN